MIILPNTPPTPTSAVSSALPGLLAASRAALSTPAANRNDLVRYLVALEEYLDAAFGYLAQTAGSLPHSIAEAAASITVSISVPWENLNYSKKAFRANETTWTLQNDMDVAIAAVSLVYTALGSELSNELIETDPLAESTADTNEKWKKAVNYYKKAISYASYGISCERSGDGETLNPTLFIFLSKISAIGIQMSILSKSCWLNRNTYNEFETFKTENNGTLSRVAIYILEELRGAQSILNDLIANQQINLDYSNWREYLTVIEKYATAYAGLFLSIDYYQHDKLGQAIGLVNFSLVTLQSKRLDDIKPKKGKILTRFKTKLSSHRNDLYIANLESITTLKVNKSVFKEKSGIVLKDLSFVFDLLIQLHLKFRKENDNLKFDKVVDWQDVNADSKWPLGSKIPVTDIPAYVPKVFAGSEDLGERRVYY